MKNDAMKLLKELEWSGHSLGMGSGPMGSGGDGSRIRCCPICSGIDPSDSNAGDIHADWHGHRENCELDAYLSRDVIQVRPGVDMSVPQLFIYKVDRRATVEDKNAALDTLQEFLDRTGVKHRVICISENESFDAVGDVTLEEIGLRRIPEGEKG